MREEIFCGPSGSGSLCVETRNKGANKCSLFISGVDIAAQNSSIL